MKLAGWSLRRRADVLPQFAAVVSISRIRRPSPPPSAGEPPGTRQGPTSGPRPGRPAEPRPLFRRYCQVDEKLVDRPPRCWARASREPAMRGINNGRRPQLDNTTRSARTSPPAISRCVRSCHVHAAAQAPGRHRPTVSDRRALNYRHRSIACRCRDSAGSSASSIRMPLRSVMFARMAFVPLARVSPTLAPRCRNIAVAASMFSTCTPK